jgi:hypothetical protein
MGDQLTNKPAYDANAQTTRTYMNLVGFSAIKNAKTTDEIEVAYEKAGAANGFEKMVAKYAQADQDLSKYDTSLDPSTANVTSAFLADADTVGAVSTALPFGPYSYIQFKITEIGKTGDFDTWSELYKTYK